MPGRSVDGWLIMAVLEKLFGFSQIVVQYLAAVGIEEMRVSSSSRARLHLPHLPVPQVDLAKLMPPCTRRADLPTSARTLRLLALGLWNEVNYFKETIFSARTKLSSSANLSC